MHEWSMLSAQELIEPKSASTSHTDCGSAEILRLRSMSATATPYAAKKPIERDGMQIWPKLPASMASGPGVLQDLKKVANDGAEGTWRPTRLWWSAPTARSRLCSPSTGPARLRPNPTQS